MRNNKFPITNYDSTKIDVRHRSQCMMTNSVGILSEYIWAFVQSLNRDKAEFWVNCLLGRISCEFFVYLPPGNSSLQNFGYVHIIRNCLAGLQKCSLIVDSSTLISNKMVPKVMLLLNFYVFIVLLPIEYLPTNFEELSFLHFIFKVIDVCLTLEMNTAIFDSAACEYSRVINYCERFQRDYVTWYGGTSRFEVCISSGF